MEPIDVGGARVKITGDYSSLTRDFAAAQGVASSGAAAIGEAVTTGLAPAGAATQAFGADIDRLIAAIQQENAALSLSIQRNLSFAESENVAAASVRNKSEALNHQVSEIQATSGAIRVLEGSGGLRAAERFLTTIPGIGGALQAAFPLVGLLAVGEIVSRIAEKFGGVSEKQKEANEEAKQFTAQLAAADKEVQSLTVHLAEMQNGAVAGASLALQDAVRQANAAQKSADDAREKLGGGTDYKGVKVPVHTSSVQVAPEAQAALETGEKAIAAHLAVTTKLTELDRARAAETGRLQGSVLANQEHASAATIQLAQTTRQITESQAHAAVQAQINEMHDRQQAAVASAAEELRIAKQKESDITADMARQLPARIALIQQQGAAQALGKSPDEQPVIQAQTAGKVQQARAEADQKRLESHAAVIEAENRLDEANATHAREMAALVKKYWTDAYDGIESAVRSLETKETEAADRAYANAIRVADIEGKSGARIGEINAKGSGDVAALGIERQKLQAEQAYGAQVAHTGQDEIAHAKELAALDSQGRAAKIAGVQAELAIAQQADSENQKQAQAALIGSAEAVSATEAEAQTKAKVAGLQQQINALTAQGANDDIAAQTKILELKQKQNLGRQLAGDAYGAITKTLPSALGQGLANGIVGGKHGEDVGKQVGDALKNAGKQLLGEAFTQIISKLIAEIVIQTGIQAVFNAIFPVAATAQTVATTANTVGVVAQTVATAVNTAAMIALTTAVAALAVATYIDTGTNLFGFATGGSVPQDMVARVHKGEYVLNANQAAGREPLPDMFQTPVRGASAGSSGSSSAASLSAASSSSSNDVHFHGEMHFHGVQNARAMMREVSAIAKNASPSHSPYSK